VSEITQGLKAIAKELNIPVLALSQLSRAVEQRDDKRPQLSDLRESGSIEQDADLVMFIYREQYYLERTKPSEDTPEFQAWREKNEQRWINSKNKAEVIISKHRNGPIGSVYLQFMGDTTSFHNLDMQHSSNDIPL
jgi:replicative DNA helicase